MSVEEPRRWARVMAVLVIAVRGLVEAVILITPRWMARARERAVDLGDWVLDTVADLIYEVETAVRQRDARPSTPDTEGGKQR